jgi:hypothetical protein
MLEQDWRVIQYYFIHVKIRNALMAERAKERRSRLNCFMGTLPGLGFCRGFSSWECSDNARIQTVEKS